MRSECESVSLGSLGVLRVRGADTRSFLQGQVSSDVAQLAAQRSLLAGYHNPQGRVIALLRLLQLAPDDVLAILPRELVAPVAQRLAKFILRAKAKVADESAQWTISGLVERDPASGATGQAAPRSSGVSSPTSTPPPAPTIGQPLARVTADSRSSAVSSRPAIPAKNRLTSTRATSAIKPSLPPGTIR